MHIVIIIFHVLICFLLIGAVLLQSGKGAETGAAFGGSSQTLFGSRGATPFLSKLTIGIAVFYMITSISLTAFKKDRSVLSSMVEQEATGSSTSTSTPIAATSTTENASTTNETSTSSSDLLSLPTPTAIDQTASSVNLNKSAP